MKKELQPEFWKKKPLQKLSKTEWEALCAHCGRCCLVKQGDNNATFFTNVHCKHLSCTGECQIYDKRLKQCNCVAVNYKMLKVSAHLLPDDCPYKLLYQGKDLPSWHPLVSGNPNTVHLAGKSVREMITVSEDSSSPLPLQFLFMTEK